MYGFLLFLAIIILKRKQRNARFSSISAAALNYKLLATGSVLGLFALAAITHLMGDFPVHAKDAHPHFWPFTTWRFHSSVSYWDHRYYGNVFSLLEALLGIMLSIILFRRFNVKWVKILAVLAICAYVAVPVYFKLALGS